MAGIKKGFSFIWVCCIQMSVFGQQHNQSRAYVWPTDTAVLHRLHDWQDNRFGLLMHWGTYSQWGVVESWSICPEDEDWTKRRGPHAANYTDYVHAYEQLQTVFNPTAFNPEKWARAAADAGMKYVVFTTKHHDGFCMFDTQQTDYKITSVKSPFSSNPKKNITKEIFSAFRARGFMTGAYFSKPDWHAPDYWWSYFPPKDRNVNYDPKKYPDRWKAFQDFTYNQIEELMTGYGPIDILWLDGGWVRPLSSIDSSVSWQKAIPYDQDINMKRIVGMARHHQPGLLVVDRTVPGEYENYQTPEQTVPATPLDHPWESCITMGNSWSYAPNDHYKSSNYLVHLLIRIVSRGGNLLLNIGPSPAGDWSDTAYARLKEIGSWMKINSSAIYRSNPLAPYETGNLLFTQSDDHHEQFIFILSSDSSDNVLIPAQIQIDGPQIGAHARMELLGTRNRLHWYQTNGRIFIDIPKKLRTAGICRYACVIRVTS